VLLQHKSCNMSETGQVRAKVTFDCLYCLRIVVYEVPISTKMYELETESSLSEIQLWRT